MVAERDRPIYIGRTVPKGHTPHRRKRGLVYDFETVDILCCGSLRPEKQASVIYVLARGLRGSKSRCGRSDEERNSLFLPGTETNSSNYRSIVTP
jgi:hypothetical protein